MIPQSGSNAHQFSPAKLYVSIDTSNWFENALSFAANLSWQIEMESERIFRFVLFCIIYGKTRLVCCFVSLNLFLAFRHQTDIYLDFFRFLLFYAFYVFYEYCCWISRVWHIINTIMCYIWSIWSIFINVLSIFMFIYANDDWVGLVRVNADKRETVEIREKFEWLELWRWKIKVLSSFVSSYEKNFAFYTFWKC